MNERIQNERLIYRSLAKIAGERILNILKSNDAASQRTFNIPCFNVMSASQITFNILHFMTASWKTFNVVYFRDTASERTFDILYRSDIVNDRTFNLLYFLVELENLQHVVFQQRSGKAFSIVQASDGVDILQLSDGVNESAHSCAIHHVCVCDSRQFGMITDSLRSITL